jgi:hypothetical protein
MLLLFVVVVGVAGDAVVVVVVGFGVCVEWRCPCRCLLYCERVSRAFRVVAIQLLDSARVDAIVIKLICYFYTLPHFTAGLRRWCWRGCADKRRGCPHCGYWISVSLPASHSVTCLGLLAAVDSEVRLTLFFRWDDFPSISRIDFQLPESLHIREAIFLILSHDNGYDIS